MSAICSSPIKVVSVILWVTFMSDLRLIPNNVYKVNLDNMYVCILNSQNCWLRSSFMLSMQLFAFGLPNTQSIWQVSPDVAKQIFAIFIRIKVAHVRNSNNSWIKLWWFGSKARENMAQRILNFLCNVYDPAECTLWVVRLTYII